MGRLPNTAELGASIVRKELNTHLVILEPFIHHTGPVHHPQKRGTNTLMTGDRSSKIIYSCVWRGQYDLWALGSVSF